MAPSISTFPAPCVVKRAFSAASSSFEWGRQLSARGTVAAGFLAACDRAASPTTHSPVPPNATAQGVLRAPDSDATSDGWPIAFVVASRLMMTALASQ